MEKDTTIQDKKKQKIDAIEPTDEHLTSRAGLALFVQYLQSIRLMPIMERMFASMRKNKKGLAVSDFFLQILCFFMEGSSRHLSWFDHLKRDESYAALLACRKEDLASSHAVKRFFGKFFVRGYLFRHLLQRLFIQAAEEQRINAHSILAFYHGRGNDELANRALKNFAHEQLPFKKFAPNVAWYYLMLIGNNLFEAFKEDVSEPVIALTVYADTFRRQFLDTAGKLVRHAGKLILKVPKTTFERIFTPVFSDQSL